MRSAFLSCVAWLSALESWGMGGATFDDFARLAAVAGMLGTLTVLVYRLGVWRQEMENTKHGVIREVKAHREESAANFERIERRFETLDRVVTGVVRHLRRGGRWQARTDRRLDRLEREADERAS